jgi:large subunit ribosomal protein L6
MELNIKVPENVNLEYKNNTFNVSGPKGKITKKNPVKIVDVLVNGKDITLKSKEDGRKVAAQIYTLSKHIGNMMSGVCKPYIYKMSIIYSHFPMSVAVKDGYFVISNFAGQKKQIKVKIQGDAKIDVKGKEITITSADKDVAGQIAANIENKAKVRSKDRRIFQDGIYMVEKGVQHE